MQCFEKHRIEVLFSCLQQWNCRRWNSESQSIKLPCLGKHSPSFRNALCPVLLLFSWVKGVLKPARPNLSAPLTHWLSSVPPGERVPCMDHAQWPRLDQRPACCRILKPLCEYPSQQCHWAPSGAEKTTWLFHWFHFFHPLISTVWILPDI